MQTFTCDKCGKDTDPLEQFPENLCPQCYRDNMDNVPTEELDAPDFTNTKLLNI